MKKWNTKKMILCALFAALTAIGAFIRIPMGVISMTLQFLFCALAGVLLGKNWGALSQILYVLIGLLGVPIFTKGGGFQYVLEPSFGYLLGFILAAYLIGWLIERRARQTFWGLLWPCLVGLLVLYVIGAAYMYAIVNWYVGTPMTVWTAVWSGIIIFIPGDAISAVAVAFLGLKLRRQLKTQNS